MEVEYGTPWTEVLPAHRLRGPVLLGGYHGTWVAPGGLLDHSVSVTALREVGIPLGAGIVLPLDAGARSTGRATSSPTSRPSPPAAAARASTGCPPWLLPWSRCGRATGRCPRSSGSPRSWTVAAPAPTPTAPCGLVRSLVSAYGEELDLHARRLCGYGLPAPARSPMEVPA